MILLHAYLRAGAILAVLICLICWLVSFSIVFLDRELALDIHILDEFLEKINGLDEKLSGYAKHILISPADEDMSDDSDEDLQGIFYNAKCYIHFLKFDPES